MSGTTRGMMHPEFQQVLDHFRLTYGKEEGDRLFSDWVNAQNYDTTQPAPRMLHRMKSFTPDDLTFKFYMPLEKSISKDGSMAWFGGIASNGDVDRDNERIDPAVLPQMAKDLMLNSTVFFNHKHDALPIGKVIDAHAEGDRLYIKVMPSKAKGVEDIITQIKEGILRSFSIGGKVLKAENVYDDKTERTVRVIKGLNIYEVSVVGVPANPGASISDIITKTLHKLEEIDYDKISREVEYMKNLDPDTQGDSSEATTLHTEAGKVTKARDVGAGVPAKPYGVVAGGTRIAPAFQKEGEEEEETKSEEAEEEVGEVDQKAKNPGIVKPSYKGAEEEDEIKRKEYEATAAKKPKMPKRYNKEAEADLVEGETGTPKKKEAAKEPETEEDHKRKYGDTYKEPAARFKEAATESEEPESSPMAMLKPGGTQGAIVYPVRGKSVEQVIFDLSKKVIELEDQVASIKERRSLRKGLVAQTEKFDTDISDEEITKAGFVEMFKASRNIN